MIHNIGIVDVPNGSQHPLYTRWQSMISRCYNPNDINYKTYGKRGCTVDKHWHKLSNYIEDISKKENYDKLLSNGKGWHVDKDVLIKGNKIYSNETTLIISAEDNSKERITRNNPTPRKEVIQLDMKGDLLNEYSSISEAHEKTGVAKSGISNCCNGVYSNAGGFIWKFKKDEEII